MAQVSKNGFDLMKISGEKVKGKFTKAFTGTLIAVAPLLLVAILPALLINNWWIRWIGLIIAALFVGVFQTGYIRYMRKLMNGEDAPLKLIFSEFKTGWLETFTAVVLIAMYLFGTILLLVPVFFILAYFSMTMFVQEYYHLGSLGESLKVTADKMQGNKTDMLGYKVIYFALYAVLIALAILSGYGVVLLYKEMAFVGVVLGLFCVLAFTILWCVLTVYYHAANETFFQEVLLANEKRSARRAAKKAEAESKQEVVAPAKVEKAEAKVEATPVEPAKKPAAKKPAKKTAKK